MQIAFSVVGSHAENRVVFPGIWIAMQHSPITTTQSVLWLLSFHSFCTLRTFQRPRTVESELQSSVRDETQAHIDDPSSVWITLPWQAKQHALLCDCGFARCTATMLCLMCVLNCQVRVPLCPKLLAKTARPISESVEFYGDPGVRVRTWPIIDVQLSIIAVAPYCISNSTIRYGVGIVTIVCVSPSQSRKDLQDP